MRIKILFAMLVVSAPAYAQNANTSGASSTLNVSNPSSITTRLITSPTVVAPGLAAAGIETCLGSASGGLSLMGTGLTFGGTIADPGCSIRLTARQLHAFGHPRAALALMCQDQRVSDAMASAGEACPDTALVARGGRRTADSSIGDVGSPRNVSLSLGADESLARDVADASNVKAFSAAEERWFSRDTPR